MIVSRINLREHKTAQCRLHRGAEMEHRMRLREREGDGD